MLAAQYEFHPGAIKALYQLQNYEVILIVDDSGSMNQTLSATLAQPYDPLITRWMELKQRLIPIWKIVHSVSPKNLDLYFLNHDPVQNVSSVEQLETILDKTVPNGYTPLTSVYQTVLEKHENTESKVLIIIATDGEPNVNGCPDTDAFAFVLRNRLHPDKCPTTIMACSDSERDMAWLNQLDKQITFFDVVDDFENECNEISSVQGPTFRFTKGDYIVKTLLGSIVELYGKLDSKPLQREELALYRNVDVNTLPKKSDVVTQHGDSTFVILFSIFLVFLACSMPSLIYHLSH